MAHHLARLAARSAEAHAISDVVQARLEKLQQPLAGHAFGARRVGVGVAELALEHPVGATHLLLLPQLLAVIGEARAALLSVLPRRVRSALHRTFVGKAFFALEVELLALPAAVTALVEILGHAFS